MGWPAHLVLQLEVRGQRDDVVPVHLIPLRDAFRLRGGERRSAQGRLTRLVASGLAGSAERKRRREAAGGELNPGTDGKQRTSCTGARKWFFGLRFTFRTSGLLGRPGEDGMRVRRGDGRAGVRMALRQRRVAGTHSAQTPRHAEGLPCGPASAATGEASVSRWASAWRVHSAHRDSCGFSTGFKRRAAAKEIRGPE